MAETAEIDAARTRQGLVSFTKIQEDRMSNFHDILQEEHKSISALFRKIKASSEPEQMEYNALGYMTTEIARYVTLHDGLQHLLLGVEDLVHAQPTPGIIGIDAMMDALRNITRELKMKFKNPCLTSVQ